MAIRDEALVRQPPAVLIGRCRAEVVIGKLGLASWRRRPLRAMLGAIRDATHDTWVDSYPKI